MSNIPAFPTAQYADGVRPSGFDNGMTLRDYFAAKALQALITRDGEEADCINVITTTAYQYADDMLKERLV
jgi:hypothetical protein